MNILLTGATGFLGSHLLRAILDKTDYSIILLKRSFSDVFRISDLLSNDRVIFYDIDKIDLETIFANNRIDTIIHCATNYGRKVNSCFNVLETNLMLPIKLLDLAVEYGVSNFINTDSYFNKENMAYSHLLNYSLSKKSLLLWLKYFSNKIKIVNVVLEHIFGENDNKDKFVYQMLDQIAINKVKVVDLTFGDQKRDFIYVEDVVNAYIKIIDYMNNHSFRYRSFDIGTGVAVSVKDFVKAIKDISNSNTVLNFGALSYRDDEIMCSKADIIDLKDIGWAPKYSYKKALTKMLEEFN